MDLSLSALGIDLSAPDAPRYIAVEGPIGVGKTTLVKNLAHTLNYQTLFELPHENPFLSRFYEEHQVNALATQLYFLFQRTGQLEQIRQDDMFSPCRVADFMIEKDPLFAAVTLDQEEYQLYQQIYQKLAVDAPTPDLVIYLQAPSNILQERIRGRGIEEEQKISPTYLNRLNEAYTEFFHYYEDAPILIVNAAHVDFSHNQQHYAELVRLVLNTKRGRHYYNPAAMV